jgi:hypothetical protein
MVFMAGIKRIKDEKPYWSFSAKQYNYLSTVG